MCMLVVHSLWMATFGLAVVQGNKHALQIPAMRNSLHAQVCGAGDSRGGRAARTLTAQMCCACALTWRDAAACSTRPLGAGTPLRCRQVPHQEPLVADFFFHPSSSFDP